MNGIRCPKCDLVNLLNAEACHRCGASLAELPQTAQVSVPVDQTFQAQPYAAQGFGSSHLDTEIGRKTHFWYRVYCAVMVLLNLGVGAMGLVIVFAGASIDSGEQPDAIVMGSAYAIFGLLFGLLYLVAAVLPGKPYNWIVGIVTIALGLSSCCFLPATVPLLIYWMKPETKAYFGRQ